MTSLAQLRKTALSLPGTAEETVRPGVITFTVRGKRFASLGQDKRVQLHLPATEADEVLAAHPTAERLTRGTTSIGVRVPVGDINGRQLNHWVRRAWLARAPKQLVAQAEAADTAAAGAVGDLPKGIGNPATRALANVGVTTLAQVSELSEAELLAMHGVGPKAVRLLGEALSAAGLRHKG
ncbi:MmcQ/YjbR family DNA-binding protein [Streptomyces sp. NBC_00878]|uniref:MmcQ/YjbR family DNA-binding protein n=1 Tax=Streptomyces sp. NBC_00878 TaxID=2975854 RepID=UPI00225822BD|nr:MmcQ/YjbR family DNA-binding protein [Streptomyces sp. NBC_00878]MCX4911449.1 hypothetical protein [Streptomyces sp. NBC_00878]